MAVTHGFRKMCLKTEQQSCLYVPCKDMSPNLKCIHLVSGWLGWQSACTMWRGCSPSHGCSGFDSQSQAICCRSSSVKLKTKKRQTQRKIGPAKANAILLLRSSSVLCSGPCWGQGKLKTATDLNKIIKN